MNVLPGSIFLESRLPTVDSQSRLPARDNRRSIGLRGFSDHLEKALWYGRAWTKQQRKAKTRCAIKTKKRNSGKSPSATTMKAENTEKKSIKKTTTKGPSTSKQDRWTVRFQECKAYREKFGNCKVPTKYKENKSLGVWVQEQRRNYKLVKQGKKPRYSMTDEQIEKLDEIGFHWGWTPDPNLSAESEASWEAHFSKLQAYQESHGNFDVPMESTTLKLAKWARVQRNQYNLRATKRKSFMTKERIEKLDGIGFDWDGPRKID